MLLELRSLIPRKKKAVSLVYCIVLTTSNSQNPTWIWPAPQQSLPYTQPHFSQIST